jgi:hypothetical protein
MVPGWGVFFGLFVCKFCIAVACIIITMVSLAEARVPG